MTFLELLEQAQAGQQIARERLLLMYKPLLLKAALVDDVFDEDLYQELCIVFLGCICTFEA